MKTLYLVLGSGLVLIGIVGFVMPSPLFGLFQVNPLHNAVHVLSGALTLFASTQGIGAMRLWGKLFGLVYLAMAILGFVMPDGDILGLMRVNMPDSLMYLALAAVFLYVGLLAPPTL